MSDVKGLDFSNIHVHQILQKNSIPKAGGSLNLADSATYTMSKLGTLFVTVKLRPYLSMGSSDSVRTCSDKFRTNFSDPWIAFGVAVVWWWSFVAKSFRIWISFCLKRNVWRSFPLLPGCRVDLTDLLISGKKFPDHWFVCSMWPFWNGRTRSYLLAGPCWPVKLS
jgi:hypothetical protein